ncbi:hypothetical protein C8E83_0128 [Frondihabitans australicus]|uniref:Uncharacterized protein n=2 Tax=Frondihabitans australicus TaxID=386892 RepID=A0A495IDF9_9MICO|nr:hypothetical protein C8E83_0128 [Frondihabitans australicus]
MPSLRRTLLAYSIHGRTNEGVIDYPDFFERFFAESVVGIRYEVGDQMVSVTQRVRDEKDDEVKPGAGALRFVSGSATELPLFYDNSTGRDEVIELSNGLIVNAVWIFVDPESRILVTERKRPGVGIGLIARYFELRGRDLGYPNLRIDLNPSPSSEFAAEVERLTEIKSAEIVLSRPNLDWGDTEADVHAYADKSGASKAKIEMTAPRGGELSKASGIIHDIIELARKPITSLKDVAVTGKSPADAGTKRISLGRFQRKANVLLPAKGDAASDLEALSGAAHELIDATALDTVNVGTTNAPVDK